MVEYGNVILCHGIGKIGGIETFFYELARKYGDYDITIAYSYGDEKQLRRLKKYVRCIRLTEKIKCKKCFLMYSVSTEMVEAEEYIQLIHADYKTQNLPVNSDSKISKYYGVSKWVADAYKELLENLGIKKDVEVCYNPIQIDKPRKILRLISATRLSKEKGLQRMRTLATRLTEANIPFIWTVFTDSFERIDNSNVIYMSPRLDIRDYIADNDYLVQLSDTEACPYSILESLSLKVPVIVTPIPSLKELGVNDTNSYTIDFDMKDIPVEDIYNKIPEFDYTPPKDIWDELLVHDKRTYDPTDLVEVITLRTYEHNGAWSMANQKKLINREEANELIKLGYVKELDT